MATDLSDVQIPPEVEKAFREGWTEDGPDWFARLFARCLAAWPLAFQSNMTGLSEDLGTPSDDVLILPLTEKRDG